MKLPKIKDGWNDLPATDYHKLSGMSSGAVKELIKSHRHCWAYMHDPVYKEPTPSMMFGSAFHSYALEYHRGNVATLPDGIDRRTKAGKEAYAEFLEQSKGKSIITKEQAEQLQGMVNAIKDHPAASALFQIRGQLHEASGILLQHPVYGFACKIRPDILSRQNGLIIDLKSTVDASPEKFPKQMANLLYHWQAWWYQHIAGLLDKRFYSFIIIAVEKTAPFGVAVYEVSNLWLRRAQESIEPLLEQYAAMSDEQRQAAGYPEEIIKPSMPTWTL